MYTESEILDFVNEENVKFIRLAFFDIKGNQKNISIMSYELQNAFKYGVSFDASAVTGFESPEKSDLFLHPDPSTLAVLPWRPTDGKVVRMFCNIKHSDGTPYKKDSRFILQKAIDSIKTECGLKLNFGAEVEFYLFKLNENGEPTKIPFDNAGYMDIAPDDKGENIRRDICFTLEKMGITPEASHHEEGPGQNEIDFKYSDPLSAADNSSTFKWIVRTKASSNGVYADFSPKPIENQPGNSMHINISYTPLDSSDKTDYLPFILGGIMNHIEEITFFLNPTKDSYLRHGECKAPLYITAGIGNRSTCVRIPTSKLQPRLEVRSPDPGCNPYIAFALLIYSAIDGIKNKIASPELIQQNLFGNNNIDESIKTLPKSLKDAYKIASSSEFVKNCLGKEFAEYLTTLGLTNAI